MPGFLLARCPVLLLFSVFFSVQEARSGSSGSDFPALHKFAADARKRLLFPARPFPALHDDGAGRGEGLTLPPPELRELFLTESRAALCVGAASPFILGLTLPSLLPLLFRQSFPIGCPSQTEGLNGRWVGLLCH